MSKESFTESLSPYLVSVQDAQSLLHSKESVGEQTRRDMIMDVLNSMSEVNEDDEVGVNEIVNKTRKLLISDPLSDQQAGLLTRWMWEANYWGQGSFEEALELRVGNWKTIQEICTSTFERREAWEKAKQNVLEGNDLTTVYRGMSISPVDIQRIYRFGIVPPGLNRYGTFYELLMKYGHFRHYFSNDYSTGYFKTEKAKTTHLIDGPFSKSGLLRNHWLVDPETWGGTDTPESLAISTTPTESMVTARRYGKHIIEIQIPANRLVSRWKEYGMVDCSVLYYIDPSEIKGIYEVKNYTDIHRNLIKPVKRST